MNDSTRSENRAATLLGQAADEFIERLQLGEDADIETYARRYPEIATVIRDVFPALGATTAVHPDTLGQDNEGTGLPARDHQLGDFRVVRELGRGGMGVVYEAVQLSLGRRVALKVLPFAAVLDNKQLQRFHTEAQAAAQLHHGSIVPVYFVGCERGVHFYAMQYIEGHTLSSVIEQLRELNAPAAHEPRVPTDSSSGLTSLLMPSQGSASVLTHLDGTRGGEDQDTVGLTPSPNAGRSDWTAMRPYHRAVARIGIEATDALQHAHDHGVIHRDIKPANLLLDAGGKLWITDFGLAAVQGGASLTLSGDLLGTMRYMSPEQARTSGAPLDHRTDIYALGATLYELLTLRTVVLGKDRQEILNGIAHCDPPPIRRLAPAVPRALATIVHKAIGKLPTERYASAAEMGADLRRFLEDRPILAKPPSTLDRASKWVTRHKALVTLGAVFLALLTIASATGLVLISQERQKALQQRDLAADRAASAEANLQFAQLTFDRMLMNLADQGMDGGPLGYDLREVLLQDALVFQEGFLNRKEQAATVRDDVARAYTRVGHINALLGRNDRAADAYRAGLAILADLAADAPERQELIRDLAETRMAFARLLCDQRRADEAGVPADLALADCCRLVEAVPLEQWPRELMVDAHNVRGFAYRDTGDLARAESSFSQAADWAERLACAYPGEPRHRCAQAQSMRYLADVRVRGNDWTGAGEVLDAVLETQKRLVAAFPAIRAFSADLAATERWWDDVQRIGGPRSDTATHSGNASVRQQLTDALPRIPWYRERLARAYGELGSALQRLDGHSGEDLDAVQEAIVLLQALAAEYPQVAKYREELANLFFRQAMAAKVAWQMADAAKAFQRARTIQQGLVDAFPAVPRYRATLIEIDRELADAAGKCGRDRLVQLGKQSPAGVAKAVEIAKRASIDGVPQEPYVLLIYGEYLALGGEYERACAFIRRAIEIDGPSPSHYKSLAWALLGCNRPDDARAALNRALGALPARDAPTILRQCPDPVTAAYYLDLVSENQYTHGLEEMVLFGQRYSPFPWFYVGVRRELAGDPRGAEAAYRTSAEFGKLRNAHHTAHWAAYRLTIVRDR